jgi:hypothetical protein
MVDLVSKTSISMENKKVSKKALRSLLKDSLQQSIGHLELPKPNKKVKKIIERSTKKMAVEFSYLLKKEFKRSNPKKKEKTEDAAHAA